MPSSSPSFLSDVRCLHCLNDFDWDIRRPVTLVCGHTICVPCSRQLPMGKCPHQCQTSCSTIIERLPINYPLARFILDTVKDDKIYQNSETKYDDYLMRTNLDEESKSHFISTQTLLQDMQEFVKPIVNRLPRLIIDNFLLLLNCQYVEHDGRVQCVKAAYSLGERILTEYLAKQHTLHQSATDLWQAIKSRGCRFLGPAMQEEVLKLIILALQDGSAMTRKVLILFVVQKLQPGASKTRIGHVIQLLYRASCFMVQKRDDESSLMQLKPENRNYEALRREHDAQIVQIAQEAGLRISPEQWSSLLYGNPSHKLRMETILDKVLQQEQQQTSLTFQQQIQELTQRNNVNSDVNQNLIKDFQLLQSAVDSTTGHVDETFVSMRGTCEILQALKNVFQVFAGMIVDSATTSHASSNGDLNSSAYPKYKVSLCRDHIQKGACPRGIHCTYAHSKQEMDKFRASANNDHTVRQSRPSLNPTTRPWQQSYSSTTAEGTQQHYHHHYHHLHQHPTPPPPGFPQQPFPAASMPGIIPAQENIVLTAALAQAMLNPQAYYPIITLLQQQMMMNGSFPVNGVQQSSQQPLYSSVPTPSSFSSSGVDGLQSFNHRTASRINEQLNDTRYSPLPPSELFGRINPTNMSNEVYIRSTGTLTQNGPRNQFLTDNLYSSTQTHQPQNFPTDQRRPLQTTDLSCKLPFTGTNTTARTNQKDEPDLFSIRISEENYDVCRTRDRDLDDVVKSFDSTFHLQKRNGSSQLSSLSQSSGQSFDEDDFCLIGSTNDQYPPLPAPQQPTIRRNSRLQS
ncbi:unnamed protein product [Didymodactylos carnosus]|uniref:RING-type E3 ubiquitin transferase n=2 Tax=Didymodactylos carnosus TaxID=1234261 RepID=A0A814DAJ2_9BILA|nr:unnamed protein product [Didymodactylos carnosus]CAF3728683.1 unnamed protein product [Didymodactylos carnosus]